MVVPANGPPPVCEEHKIPARLWSTHKDPNKKFYRCGMPIGHQCKLFEWVDSEEISSSQANASPPSPNTDGPSSDGPKLASSTTPNDLKRNVSALDQHDEGRDESGKRAKVTSNDGESPPGSFSQRFNRDQKHLDASHQTYGTPGWASSQWPPSTPPRISDQTWSRRKRLLDMSRRYIDSPAYESPIGHSPVPSSSQETLQGESYQEPNAEAITDMIRQLQNLHGYVQKLERKKIAAEKSRDAKNSKMDSLQEQVKSLEREVQRLKNRELELEEVIAAYERPA